MQRWRWRDGAVLCSGVSYLVIRPSWSNRCMLLVLMEVDSLNFFTSPSATAAAMFSGLRCTSKCTDVSVWYSLMSCNPQPTNTTSE